MPLRRILLSAINLVPLISLALMISCARPLGPSYTIEKQTLALRFIPQPRALLDVQAHFQVLASGRRPLPAIDIQLPDEKLFSPQDLQITLDGHDVSSAPVKDVSRRTVRIQFNSSLQPGRRQNLFIHYTLPAPSGIDSAMASAAFVAGGDWHPVLLSPKGMFAKLFVEFNKWDLEIRVPQDFLVHASGRVRRTKQDNDGLVYVLQHRTGEVPFVVAGRYREQLLRASLPHHVKDQVVFWTLQPIPADAVQQAGSRIAQVMAAYDHRFGARIVRPNSLWVVECLPSRAPSANADAAALGRFCDSSLPDTVLLPASAWTGGVASSSFQENTGRAMAYLWLGRPSSSPTRDDRSFSGIYAYAAHDVLLDRFAQLPSAQNDPNARQKLITRYLMVYDQKSQPRNDAIDKSPSTPSPKNNSAPEPSSGPSSEPALEKSVLFFFALEDQYGPQLLHRAIARMVHALGEEGYNRNDLRAALEGETQKNAADFFHRWLDRPGIPEGFRVRYENKSAAAHYFFQGDKR